MMAISLSHDYGKMLLFVLEPLPLPKNTSVFSDEMVVIGATQNQSEDVFCFIKVLHLLTNRLDFDTDEITELYKSR